MTNHYVLLNEGPVAGALFVIPGVGGRTEMYKDLARAFAGTCRVYGLNMCGTEKGERPLDNIRAIAAQNIAWMTAAVPEGPYFLLGHSFGAYVAYEMAKQLERGGRRAARVYILDQEARLMPSLGPANDAIGFALELAKGYYTDFKVVREWPDQWSDELLCRLIERDSREFSAVIHDYVRERLLNQKRRLVELASRLIELRMCNALMDYQPEGQLYSPLTVFKAGEEKLWDTDGYLGWRGRSKSLEVHTVPGNHISMIFKDNAVVLAGLIINRTFA